MPTTASTIEIIWTLAALVGLAVNAWALLDALYDLRALHLAHLNGAREIVAKGNIRRELGRIFVQLCFLAIGLVAMSQPAARPAKPPSLLGIIFTLALIAAAASLGLGAVLDRAERRRLIAYITAHLDQHEGC